MTQEPNSTPANLAPALSFEDFLEHLMVSSELGLTELRNTLLEGGRSCQRRKDVISMLCTGTYKLTPVAKRTTGTQG